MKKTNEVVLMLIMMGLVVACKKNYTCSCLQTVTYPAYSYNGEDHPQEVIMNSFTNTYKSKKKEAESDCKMGESVKTYPSTYAQWGQAPTTEVVTCELK